MTRISRDTDTNLPGVPGLLSCHRWFYVYEKPFLLLETWSSRPGVHGKTPRPRPDPRTPKVVQSVSVRSDDTRPFWKGSVATRSRWEGHKGTYV